MRYIYPYKAASQSARNLADQMNIPLIGRDIHLARGRPEITIINWGSGDLPAEISRCRVINRQDAIGRAVNKLSTFRALHASNVAMPEWTESRTEAARWLSSGSAVCARTTLEGKDGDGLILMKEHKTDWLGRPLEIPTAPLYTKFIRARAEYRINVCNGTTMGVQLKVPTGTNPNHDIKTGGNGYAFRLLDENEIPRGIRPVARAAVTALGLDFGGVDLIVGLDGRAYVLEINTAPELTPAMIRAYATELARM